MASRPVSLRADAKAMAALFVFALGVEITTAILGVARSPDPLPSLAVYFDGHKYLEIARSFPLPYSAEGRELLGHAPGYPAFIALARVFVPGALDWGVVALVVSWVAGAAAALAFFALCRQLSVEPLWPCLLFVVANPRWIAVSATAHAEPLAMLFGILCLTAGLRGRLGWAVVWLTLASLARFPAIVLGLPLAWQALRRAPSLKSVALLSVPPAALVGFELYLRARIPGFEGVVSAHSFWWEVQWTAPFLGFFRHPDAFPPGFGLREVTWIFAALYAASIALGLRSLGGELRLLPLWVAATVLFSAAAGDPVGVAAFTRLALLAWPAALLILWMAWGRAAPRALLAALTVALLLGGLWFATRQIRLAIYGQKREQPYLIESIQRLGSDEPRWLDFREIRRRKQQGR